MIIQLFYSALFIFLFTSCVEPIQTKITKSSAEQEVDGGVEVDNNTDSYIEKSCVPGSVLSLACDTILNAKISDLIMRCLDDGSGYVEIRGCQVSLCDDPYEVFGNSCEVVSDTPIVNDEPEVSISDTVGLLFRDSFESADMSTQDGENGVINNINFSWQMNRTGIVKQSSIGAEFIYPTAYAGVREGIDWTARDGEYSLAFDYAAGINMAEQRFSFNNIPEVWMSYWIRVPVNFYQGSLNNKFLALWGSTYDQAGDITWQTRPSGNGNAILVVQPGGVGHSEILGTPFINVQTDRGRWMKVVVHAKTATSQNSNDGVIELWRKWEDEESYTKIHEMFNAPNLWESGTLGFRNGYLMGWANDPYDQDTEWLIDDFQMGLSDLTQVTPEPVSDGCMVAPLPIESDLVEAAPSDSDDFFYMANFEDTDKSGIKGEITSTRCYSGEQSIDSRSRTGSAYSTVGAIRLPRNVKDGEELWLRLRVFFPENYIFSSCQRLGLANCGYPEGNDDTKFIGMNFNVSNQGRHWFNFYHDDSRNQFYWMYEGHGDSYTRITDEGLRIVKGRWETFEYYTKLSTNLNEGKTRVYKNGVLILDETTRTINHSEMAITSIYLLEYWNGGAPADQSAFFDEIIVTTKTPKKRDSLNRPFLGM